MMRIACVGDNCIDYYDDTKEMFPGGNPVNVAVYVRRLGGESAYVGVVGTDEYGKVMVNALAEKGVDVSHVQVCPGATALSHVRRIDGERVFGDYEEGVMEYFTLSDEEIDFLCTYDLVVSGLWGRTENHLHKVREHGVPVAFDCAERPFDPAALTALPQTNVAFFADDTLEEAELKEKILKVAAMGPQVVVATRGSHGSIAYDGEKFYTHGITPCEVADTMGAGDSFIAGFLTGWLQHKPMEKCMEDGAKNAAVTIAYCGAW